MGNVQRTLTPSWGNGVDGLNDILKPLKSRTKYRGGTSVSTTSVLGTGDKGHIPPSSHTFTHKKSTPHMVGCLRNFTPKYRELRCLLPPKPLTSNWMQIKRTMEESEFTLSRHKREFLHDINRVPALYLINLKYYNYVF